MLQGFSGLHRRAQETQGGVVTHPERNEDGTRVPADPPLQGEGELEMMRRMRNLNRLQVNSTQGINFNTHPEGNPLQPPIGHSATPVY